MLRVLVEAKTSEYPGRPRRCAMRVDRIKPFVNFTDTVGILAVLGFRQQQRALGCRGEHGRERRRGASWRLLGDIADTHARRSLDGSVVGFIEPGNDLQQARFTCTVAPHEANVTLRRQGCRSAIKDEMAAQAQGNAFKGEHGAAIATQRIPVKPRPSRRRDQTAKRPTDRGLARERSPAITASRPEPTYRSPSPAA